MKFKRFARNVELLNETFPAILKKRGVGELFEFSRQIFQLLLGNFFCTSSQLYERSFYISSGQKSIKNDPFCAGF